jgi:hypothetical protein
VAMTDERECRAAVQWTAGEWSGAGHVERVMQGMFTRKTTCTHESVFVLRRILFSILNSSVPIHPLYHPLSTLSAVGPTCHFI